MNRKLKLLVALSASVLALVMTTGAGGAASPFTVKSSLDGKTVLPHRIYWLGYPSLAAAKVAKVEFLVDGKLGWVEHKAPYVYGADDNGHNRGYLVTSWLAAGMHRFTVRVTATDGTIGSDTVTARVATAAAPPSALAGTWRRTIDTTNAPKPGSVGNPTETFTPSGSYTLTFERRWARDKFPGSFVLPQSNKTGHGFVFLNDYIADATRIHLVGEVIFHPLSDELAEGGAWCTNAGPPADYRWSVAGDTLTLAPASGKDACGIRGFIWTGEWTRVG
jgi:hypothetical protein